jgi:hypothetical protein
MIELNAFRSTIFVEERIEWHHSKNKQVNHGSYRLISQCLAKEKFKGSVHRYIDDIPL